MKSIICHNCKLVQTITGYENFDENGNWFCSYECERKNNLQFY